MERQRDSTEGLKPEVAGPRWMHLEGQQHCLAGAAGAQGSGTNQAVQVRGVRWRDLSELQLQLQREGQRASSGSDAGGPLWDLIENNASARLQGRDAMGEHLRRDWISLGRDLLENFAAV